MLTKRFLAFAQVVGVITIALLAVYGFVAILNGGKPVLAVGQARPAARAEAARTAASSVPGGMNYQGYLRDDEGNLLSGYYTMTFSIYTGTVGGTALWHEELISVTVRDGYFNVLLGDSTSLPANLFTDPDRYIGVTVAPYDEMVPRQRFASVPYAFQAERATGLSALDGDPADAVTVDNDGDLNVAGHVNGGLIVEGPISGTSLNVGSGDLYARQVYASGLISGSVIKGDSLSGGAITGDSLNVGSGDISGGAITGDSLNVGSGNITGGAITGDSLNVGGSITAIGDINWTGDLKGFATNSYELNLGTMTMTLRANSVCFLTHIYSEIDLEYTSLEFTRCRIHGVGDYWVLEVAESPHFGVVCGATCLSW